MKILFYKYKYAFFSTSMLKKYVESQCLEYMTRLEQINGVNDLNLYQPTLISAWTIKQSANDYQDKYPV